MVRIIWSRPALDDLSEIRAWIARGSHQHAERIVRGIRGATNRLKTFPEMGRTVPESESGSHRELIYGSYRIIYQYQPEQNVVTIVAVMHGSREIPPLPGDV